MDVLGSAAARTARLANECASAMIGLLVIAIALRSMRIVFSSTAFGYVWDFYYEGVRLIARTGYLLAFAVG